MVAEQTMISLDEFRAEAQRFLDDHAEPRPERTAFVWGEGSDTLPSFEEFGRDDAPQLVRDAKRWAADRFDAGFGWIDGPQALGGAGLSAEHARVYRELETRYSIPNMALLTIGAGIIAPTLLAHGSPEVHKKYLAGIYRGDIVACQLFSEPNAGSDLASARTRATRDGDVWTIDGQKVWTSNAHVADIGLAVARTDPAAPKHHGLTLFVVDMHASGVEVRPLRQMTGSAGFSETFLTDVRVDDADRVGQVNEGFRVIITTLGSERSIPAGAGTISGPGFEHALALARHFARLEDPLVRQQLASIYATEKISEVMTDRLVAAMKAGENSAGAARLMLLKLVGSARSRELSSFVTGILGDRLIADTGEWGTYVWSRYVLGVPGGGIGGGTNEVVRNRIGETVLGLPKEPAVQR
jgi:alkylation response protein AidB-like acyl-CoA dehydrogenase